MGRNFRRRANLISLQAAMNEAINNLKNDPLVRKIIINRMTEKEIAELSLFLEGECDLSPETSQKVDEIWLEILKGIDPVFCEFVKHW